MIENKFKTQKWLYGFHKNFEVEVNWTGIAFGMGDLSGGLISCAKNTAATIVIEGCESPPN